MITKEECKEFALKIKQETGKFPILSNWLVRNNYPCSSYMITKLFQTYNNFRDYCNEPHLLRSGKVTLDWIKSNCIIDENQCWNWNKSSRDGFYGKTAIGHTTYSTHRLSYELQYGTIDSLLLIRHKCDNKNCCNPEHLEIGNHADNALDVIKRNVNYNPNNNLELSWKVRRITSLEERLYFYIENSYKLENCSCIIPNLLKPLKDGYFKIKFNYQPLMLHRAILASKLKKEYKNIDIARHTCNNKYCINPDHLIEGSTSDNNFDSRSYSKVYKLKEENVMKIKSDINNWNFSIKGNKSKFDIKWSTIFDVSTDSIKSIRLGRTWGKL